MVRDASLLLVLLDHCGGSPVKIAIHWFYRWSMPASCETWLQQLYPRPRCESQFSEVSMAYMRAAVSHQDSLVCLHVRVKHSVLILPQSMVITQLQRSCLLSITKL